METTFGSTNNSQKYVFCARLIAYCILGYDGVTVAPDAET